MQTKTAHIAFRFELGTLVRDKKSNRDGVVIGIEWQRADEQEPWYTVAFPPPVGKRTVPESGLEKPNVL